MAFLSLLSIRNRYALNTIIFNIRGQIKAEEEMRCFEQEYGLAHSHFDVFLSQAIRVRAKIFMRYEGEWLLPLCLQFGL